MDLDSLKNQVSNITLYDLKAGFRKAQNAVMNYTEMEAKVREATNNEPWGCSTSDMQQIANGTFNYATLNEIMPMIYKRFTEKSAEEWRQIYKALQLLEFLIKNGSERVIDDARSHMSLLKMLRQFHYIDQNGKDQGMNVRNRAKELAELLSDVERIRSERKKARASKNKYGGVEGGMGIGGGNSSTRYGGFGSETGGGAISSTYGGYSGGVYGDGGGFGGGDYGGEMSSGGSRRDRFEEYDEYDEGTVSSSSRRTGASSRTTTISSNKPEPPAKPKEPEVDLFDFGDDNSATITSNNNGGMSSKTGNVLENFGGFEPMPTVGRGVAGAAIGEEDDFDDFQSATTTQTNIPMVPPPPGMSSPMSKNTQQQPLVSAPSNALFDAPISPSPAPHVGTTPGAGANYAAFNFQQPISSPTAQQRPLVSPVSKPTGYQQAAPNYFGSIQTTSNAPILTPGSSSTTSGLMSPPLSSSSSTIKAGNNSGVSKSGSTGVDPFANLAIGGGAKKPAQAQKGPSMADMAKEKASAGIWGAPAAGQQQQQQQYQGGSLF